MNAMLYARTALAGAVLGTCCTVTASAQEPAAPAHGLDLDRLEHVADSVAHHHLASHVTPGMTIAVARDGEILFEKGYGAADVEMGVAAGPETVYRIGSITKQFTAAAVLRLVEAGALSLDDPITDYLPDYPTQGHTVTVRHLLNHTSGIRSYTGLGETFWSVSRLDLSEDELVDLFDHLAFDFEPGAGYKYNNSAYYLLGVIVGKVTGEPYRDHLESELLAPLGLEHTRYCDNTRIVPERAEGYEYDENGELVNAEYISMTNPGAAGAMCSTVEDLVRWTELLHDGAVVGPASFRAMTSPAVLSTGDTTSYGFGLGLGELGGHRKVAHGGGINGFASTLARYPDRELTTVVLTNAGSGNAAAVEDVIARTALSVPLEVIADIPLSDEELRRFTGRYAIEAGGNELVLRFTAEGSHLFVQAEGQSRDRLRFQGDDVFVPQLGTGVRFVFSGEGRRADTVVLEQGGTEYRGRRVD